MVRSLFLIAVFSSYCFSQTTFHVGADAYIQYSTPTTNYGSASDMRCRNTASDTLRPIFNFSPSGLTGTVTACSLKLYVTLGGASSGGQLWSITDDSWTEGGVTWNTQPSRVTDLGALPVATASTWISHAVTSYVTGNDTYSFIILANNSQNTRYESDEAAGTNDALLVVYTAAGTTRRKVIFGDSMKVFNLYAEMKNTVRHALY